LSAVIRRVEQARAFKVASVVLGPPPRRRAPAWRPVVAHAVPRSTPRPPEQCSAPRGRDGIERDDGSGSDDDGGGGDPPPQRSDEPLAGGAS